MTTPPRLELDPHIAGSVGGRFWRGLLNGLLLAAVLWATVAALWWLVAATVRGW